MTSSVFVRAFVTCWIVVIHSALFPLSGLSETLIPGTSDEDASLAKEVTLRLGNNLPLAPLPGDEQTGTPDGEPLEILTSHSPILQAGAAGTTPAYGDFYVGVGGSFSEFVFALDALGSPVPNALVTLTISGNELSFDPDFDLQTLNVLTDGNGVAFFDIYARFPSLTPASVTLNATAADATASPASSVGTVIAVNLPSFSTPLDLVTNESLLDVGDPRMATVSTTPAGFGPLTQFSYNTADNSNWQMARYSTTDTGHSVGFNRAGLYVCTYGIPDGMGGYAGGGSFTFDVGPHRWSWQDTATESDEQAGTITFYARIQRGRLNVFLSDVVAADVLLSGTANHLGVDYDFLIPFPYGTGPVTQQRIAISTNRAPADGLIPVTITVIDDGLDESDETVVARLANPDVTSVIDQPDTHTHTIMGTGPAPDASVGFTTASTEVEEPRESDADIAIGINLSGASATDARLLVTLQSVTGTGATGALVGGPLTTQVEVLIPAGQTTGAAIFRVTADPFALGTGVVSFLLSMTAVTPNVTLATQSTHIVNVNQPVLPQGIIQFEAAAGSETEGASAFVAVAITPPTEGLQGTTRVLMTYQDITTEFADYLPNPNSVVTFVPGGPTRQTIEIPLLADALNEGPETLRLRLVSQDGFSILGPQWTHDLTILDPLPPATPVVTDGGIFTTDGTGLFARWHSSDTGSGVLRYDYSVGTAPGSTDVVNWTDAAESTEGILPVAGLVSGTQYFINVRATNTGGISSQTGSSNGITFLNPDDDPDGDSHVNNAEVSAKSDPFNPDSAPGTTELSLRQGFNLISFPAETIYYENIFNLLAELGGSNVISRILIFNPVTHVFTDVGYDDAGEPYGQNLSLPAVQGLNGLIVYAKHDAAFIFTSRYCPTWNLLAGTNLVGTPCLAPDMTAFQLLLSIGGDTVVSSVHKYNQDTGSFETSGYSNGVAVGVDFSIKQGEGYFINMFMNPPNN